MRQFFCHMIKAKTKTLEYNSNSGNFYTKYGFHAGWTGHKVG